MQRLRFFYKYSFVAAILWVVLVAIGANLQLSREENRVDEIIKSEAASTLDKDKAVAFWLMRHNGQSKSGSVLDDFTEIMGAHTQIIGYKQFDKLKGSDLWLAKILPQMQANKKEYYEILQANENHYSKLAAPMRANEKCIKCHTNIKVGDLIGVMMISMPMKSYSQMRDNVIRLVLISQGTALILGLLFIYIINRITKRHIKSIEKQKEKEIKDYEEALNLMVELTEERDAYTAGHAERVAKYCELIAKELGLNESKISALKEASRLHDIGKIAVPDTVLLKPGKLDESEYKAIQSHVLEGYKILSGMQRYSHLAEIIKYHHERYDGNGYPYGKKGKDIPIESSIMAAADAFDAMTSNRIYKTRKNVQEALEELRVCKGTQFHPDVADAAIKALENVEVPKHISQLDDSIRQEHKMAFFFKDSLTGLYNLEFMKTGMSNYAKEAEEYKCVSIISIKNLGKFNNVFGWEEGDKLLKSIAEFVKNNCEGCVASRVYGDIFIIASKTEHHICSDSINKLLPQNALDMDVSIICKKMPDMSGFDYTTMKQIDG